MCFFLSIFCCFPPPPATEPPSLFPSHNVAPCGNTTGCDYGTLFIFPSLFIFIVPKQRRRQRQGEEGESWLRTNIFCTDTEYKLDFSLLQLNFPKIMAPTRVLPHPVLFERFPSRVPPTHTHYTCTTSSCSSSYFIHDACSNYYVNV